MILEYKDKEPKIDASCFVAKNATVIGNVTLHEHVSIFFGSVIRGDKDLIEIGAYSNIQDNCTLHTDPGHRLIVKERVTIGHHALLHGALVEEEVLIGMGAIILDNAHIGKHSIIGAGALVKEGQVIPANSVAVGNPAKVIKQISEKQISNIIENATQYAQLASVYKEMEEA